MKKLFTTALVAIAALSVMALPVSAAVVFDYVGFGWESGPTKAAGDKLSVAAIADGVDAILNIDLGTTEVTFYAYDLVSTGDVIDGFGNTVTGYAGGVLEVYEDTAQDADWGIFPPNFTSPLTFTNGSLLFQGTFVDFTLILTPSGAGAFEAHLDGQAGSLLANVCSDCGYTWGGAFGPGSGAQIPDGYDFQLDGQLEVDQAISTESIGWGSIKSLYNN